MRDEAVPQEGCWFGNATDGAHRALTTSFVEGGRWPVHQASLAALLDLGLSIEQIALYFSVDRSEVCVVLARLSGARGATESAAHMQVHDPPGDGGLP